MNVKLNYIYPHSDCLGKPVPSVIWYKNDKMNSNETVNLHRDAIRSEIRIPNLGRDDVRSEITCIATNNNKSIPLTASVHVDMNCKLKKNI